MTKRIPPSELEFTNPGERLRSLMVNTFVQTSKDFYNIKRRSGFSGGQEFEGKNGTTEEIPAYSIFTIATPGSTFQLGSPFIEFAKFHTGSKVFLTNDSDPIRAGSAQRVARIEGRAIVRLKYTGVDPVTGSIVGPSEDSFTVSTEGSGLEVITEPDTTKKLIWCTPVQSLDRGQIKVKNVSGHGVLRYTVVSLTGVENTIAGSDLATYQGSPPVFTGDQPDTAIATGGWGKWCVLQQDLADDEIGDAVISGLTTVKLFKPGTVYSERNRVDIKDASHLAEENYYGAATLLDSETTGTDRYGWISIDSWQSPILRATADADIAANATGNCILTESGETVTGSNQWMEGSHQIDEDDELLVFFDRLRTTDGIWTIISAEC